MFEFIKRLFGMKKPAIEQVNLQQAIPINNVGDKKTCQDSLAAPPDFNAELLETAAIARCARKKYVVTAKCFK